MSSTESSTNSPNLEQITLKSAKVREGIKNLTGLLGVHSLLRSLKSEDDANEREYRHNEKAIHGEVYVPLLEGDSPEQTEGDSMPVLIAGDVNLPPEPRPAPVLQPPVPQNGAVKSIASAILGASLLGGGMAINNYLTQEKPVVEKQEPTVDTDTIGVLEPDKGE